MVFATVEWIIESVFGAGLFFNAALFVPQAIKVYKTKNAEGLSLLTFLGFNLVQLFTILHGYIHKDLILILGYALSLVFAGIVTVFILKYRGKNYGAQKPV
ncbi:MAG: hypothetical protein LBU35_03475 [Holosporales bacterium]|jgi:MtN3 and saliva related transmembrane protein|nr:hypothetical protein [Holosporales bacterium]